MGPAAVPPLMSSDEVNLLIYSYLAESCLDHSAFTLYSESRLGDFLNSGDDSAPSIPPTGHLIRILQKGLLYLQAEAKYRGVRPLHHPGPFIRQCELTMPFYVFTYVCRKTPQQIPLDS